MKTVANLDELRRAAVAQGASVSVEGARFNVGRQKVAALPRAAKVQPTPDAPKTPVAPVAPAAPDAFERMAQALAAHSQANERALEMMAQRLAGLAQAEPTAAAPLERVPYEFTVERDDDGRIARVIATPMSDTT